MHIGRELSTLDMSTRYVSTVGHSLLHRNLCNECCVLTLTNEGILSAYTLAVFKQTASKFVFCTWPSLQFIGIVFRTINYFFKRECLACAQHCVSVDTETTLSMCNILSWAMLSNG